MERRHFIKTVTVAATVAAINPSTMANPMTGKQTAHKFQKKISSNAEFEYLLHLPAGTKQNKKTKHPLIVFLHGMGERGTDPWKVKVHGVPKVAETIADFPFIVASPQCPPDRWWEPVHLNAFLDHLLEKYPADDRRVYLTGLSMGGYGSWSWGIGYPERFAALVPICGGGMWQHAIFHSKERIAALKSLPIWAFHGDKDNVVAPEESKRMVDGLKSLGCNVKLTMHRGVGHDSWTQTYANPELYHWFLQHARA